MAVALSFLLDIVIVVLLGVTIYYALRLSKSLNDFRGQRKEFDKLLDELTRNLTAAERSIHSLRAASTDAGKGLAEIANKSRSLVSELQIINQSGETLASRLESLIARGKQQPASAPAAFEEDYSAPARKSFDADSGPSFMINDRDFGEGGDYTEEEFGETQQDGIPDHLQSQAEKELYRALVQKKKGSVGRT
jgi:F0F1-type ATP synthase membrane subunit b/b'